MTTLPEANAKFAVDVFQSLTREHSCDNVVFSPVNLTSGFGLLALGSGCEQAAEIEKVLHWDELAECRRSSNRRYLAATRLRSEKRQEKTDNFPRPRPCPEPTRPEPTCPRPRPRPEPTRPEPTCPRPRPRPEPAKPEPECPRPRPRPEPECPRPRPRPEPECPRPRPRPCPEPCPERNVPEYECEKPEGVHTAFSKILATLNEPSVNYTLRFANKLYGDHAIAFIQKFIYCALKLYLTDVENADLQNAPEEVRRLINLWVEVRTHGKIKDLLPKGSFDCLTQLLLVNALYFKGQWDVKFDKELTKEAPFYAHHADPRDCHNVQMMNRRGIYNTGTVELCGVQVQILEIPYSDHRISLFILLPTDCSSEALEQLEDGLTHEHLLDWSCDLKPEDVDVSIPKFSLERNLEANHYVNLPELTDHEKADFSGATTTEHVALTQFIHDTSFEIDEEGGEPEEAPHCTKDRRPRRECAKFVANHPFLFFALHHCTQSLLVFGRFSKPE